jgi:hypothetical protein
MSIQADVRDRTPLRRFGVAREKNPLFATRRQSQTTGIQALTIYLASSAIKLYAAGRANLACAVLS